MGLSPGLTRGRRRAIALAVLAGALVVVAGTFARASGAGGTVVGTPSVADGYPIAEADQSWAYQRFLVSGQADMDRLNQMGVDLGEALDKNPDGTMWAYAVVTAAQRNYLARLGFRPGTIVQTEADAAKAQAEMANRARMQQQAMRLARTSHGAKVAKSASRGLATETLKVTRADYYQSSSGTWLSVEAKSSAAQGNAAVPPGTPGCPTTGSNRCGVYGGSTTGACWGNPAGGASALSTAACPALQASFSTDGGQTFQTGFQMNMQPDMDDGVYLYHFLLIKITLAANNGTAPHPPMIVKVASNYGTVATRDATAFVDTPPPYPSGFQHDFFDRYQTPEDGTAMIEALHQQYPTITQLIPATYKTNGYRRNAMASMGCAVANPNVGNSQLPGAPGATPAGFATPSTCTGAAVQSAAVVLNTWKYGQDDSDPTQNGNQVTAQFVNPGAPSSPLSVSVSGLAITVNLATDGSGALTSTAAQVVAALNADPAASAILWAATYRGNAGAGIVQPTAIVHLSDFLWAPQVGDPNFASGLQVPRTPYQQYILRICKVCDGSKTGFFVYAQEHAREWVGPLVALETANRLLKNYGSDPTTTSYVDNLDIFVDPSVNTDGGNYSMLQGGGSGQRRTMTRFCGPNNPAGPAGDVNSTSFDPAARGSWGIDDNRGFSVGSLFDGYEGASSSCTSDTYAGPGELTQPEDKNEVALETQYPNIRFSMNIHTSGGYFMWSPASYKTVNREALPYPSKGWQEEFWAAARKTVTAIKNYRGTVVTPDRTGSVVDVLYSAAGNSSDEAWYNKNIIAYDFECGVRTFSPTSTSNNGGDPGFTPNFATEGRAEGQEFADGMYGLMSSALDYQLDTTPPDDAPSLPSGTASQTPISLVFDESEPSDIYYTTDGSIPTTSSTQYAFSGFREQEGATLTFDHTTTLRWFAVDPKGNTSNVRSATFIVDALAPSTTASLSPGPVNGWYRNPTVTLSATDAGDAGVSMTQYSVDGGPVKTYTGPFTVTGDGPHTLTYYSTDNAGNVESTNTLDFKVDATDPTIAISVPANGSHVGLGKTVAAGYSCDDATSGPASCVGTVASGSPIDTSTVGTHTFTVQAADNAGNTATETVTYDVVYNVWTGFGPPIVDGGTTTRTAGSTLPIQFGIGGNFGLGILAAGYPRSQPVSCSTGQPTGPATPTASTDGLTFSGGQYQYDWRTDKAWKGTCRSFILKLNDNTVQTALIQFK